MADKFPNPVNKQLKANNTTNREEIKVIDKNEKYQKIIESIQKTVDY